MHTRSSVRKLEFSNRNQNINVDLSQFNIKTTATIAGISYQHGLVNWRNFDKSVNTDKFIEYLKILNNRFQNKKLALFMDNLRVHHTIRVREFCKLHDISIIFNVPYFPDGNPIELIFAKVKRQFKSMKTNEIANGKCSNTRLLIDKSFSAVTKEEC